VGRLAGVDPAAAIPKRFRVMGEPECAACGSIGDLGEYYSPPINGTSYAICERCSMLGDEGQVGMIRHRWALARAARVQDRRLRGPAGTAA